MPKEKEVRTTSKHAQLLDAACGLFLTHGFYAVNMDAIAQASGLSKRTIYRLHNSREALTAAVIRHDFDSWREWFFDAVRAQPGVTGAGLKGFYAVLRLWVETPDFTGCLFARVTLAGDTMPEETRQAAQACADTLHQYFSSQARKLGMNDRETFARAQMLHLLVLLGRPGSASDSRQHLIGDMLRIFEKWCK